MARRRISGGFVTVTADVDVDVSEVLEDVDTEALIAELRGRTRNGDDAAEAYLGLEHLQERDRADLAHFVACGQAQELLALLTRVMRPHQPMAGAVPYADLPRCIATRRPIVL